MPIIFIGETSAAAIGNPGVPFLVRFRVLNRNQVPQVNVPFTARFEYNHMQFLVPAVGNTDQNGEGVVNIRPIPAIGAFDLLQVTASVPGNLTERGTVPVAIYDPRVPPRLTIDRAWATTDGFAVNASDVNSFGLRIQASMSMQVRPSDSAFIMIDRYYQPRISPTPTGTMVFAFPPAINGVHLFNAGRYRVLYGVIRDSANIYVPRFTLLDIVGAGGTTPLLPLSLHTHGGDYINALDNSWCIFPVIPGGQALIAVGDRWTAFYSMQDPGGPNPEFIFIASWTVQNSDPIQFNTPPNFFPRVRNVTVWLWYTITKSDGRIYTSPPIRRILDTL